MKNFRHPSAELRAKTFWSLNGSLEENELRRQIAVLHQMGFGGAYLHSRTGLSTEYLSEEWFRLMNICADELKSHGMEAYLYDEDRYPSGVAGGYVPMEKAFRGKYITVRLVPSSEYRAEAGDIGAFSVRMKGERLIGYAPYEGGEGTVAVFSVHEREAQDVYNGYPYFDALNKNATEAFLHITLDAYAAQMGERLGDSVKGVFTDEPNRGAVFSGFAHNGEDAERRTPYTEELFPAYFERWGEKLEDILPELYFRGKEGFSRTAWRYMETLTSLFLKNYAQPYHEWCQAHGVAFTGHILHEDNLSAMATLCGSPMRFYELMDIPGVDNLTAESTNIAVPLMAASVARQCGKKGVLSEMYAAIGWQADFTTYKRIGDWHAFFGVNDRCTHLSMYTMAGIGKRDFPASILHQSVWWREYHNVEDYFARLNVFLSRGKRKAQLLWVHPVESAWGMGRMCGYQGFFIPRDSEYLALETRYWNVSNLLAAQGVAFDFGDEEMMSRLACVTRDKKGVYLRVGKELYPKVLLAANVTLRASTVALLRSFIRAGGEVLCVGEAPRFCEGIHFNAARRLNGIRFVEESELASAVLPPFKKEGGEAYTHFAERGKKRYFAAVSTEKERKEYRFLFQGSFTARKFDPRTGADRAFPAVNREGRTEVCVSLDAGEEILLELTEGKACPAPAPAPRTMEGFAPLAATNVRYKLKQPNVCVLDYARYSFEGVEGTDEILRADIAIRSALGLSQRHPEAIQPWFRKKFNLDRPCGVPVTLRFLFGLEKVPKALTLVWEPIPGARLSLNGYPVKAEQRQSDWDRCYFELPLPREVFVRGENVLEVRFPMEEDTPIEAMYLTGRFGVRTEGRDVTLCKLPETLSLGDISGQGLPFYSGELVYRFPLEKGRYTVSLGKSEGAFVRIQGKTLAFRPHAAEVSVNGTLDVSVMITQRNKFGPLHYVGESRGAFGEFCPPPELFHRGYRLIGQGLYEAPSVRKEK